MKMRKKTNTSTPPNTKKKTEGKKKNENSLAPSVVKTGAILKYFQTKKTDRKEETRTEAGRQSREEVPEKSNVKKGHVKNTVRKKYQAVNEEGKKMTFDRVLNTGVSQRMENFNRMSESTKCVIGSGFCAGHNVKLV